ncbi:MAG: zinc-binding alcohol dehydrogenase [Bryobacteraceae bacterium]
MKQAVLYGAGDLRLEERPLDISTLATDQVYVETEVTALSTGTDLGNFEGRSTEVPGAPGYPRAVGYSNAGVVVKVGSAVTRLSPGQRVFSTRPHQSVFLARETELLVPVPEGVSSEEASLSYLAQLGMAALQQAHYQPGETVTVIGLGVIGLATVALARAMGARVTAIANSPVRAAAASRVGADEVFIGNCPGNAADVVVLTANTWDAYRTAVETARYGGRVAVLGFPGRAQDPPSFNPLDAKWFYGKQLTLIGAGFSPKTDCDPWEIRFNLRRNLACILGWMAARTVALDSIITHRLPAERMLEAYELARQHSKELIAAVFDWRPERAGQ